MCDLVVMLHVATFCLAVDYNEHDNRVKLGSELNFVKSTRISAGYLVMAMEKVIMAWMTLLKVVLVVVKCKVK